MISKRLKISSLSCVRPCRGKQWRVLQDVLLRVEKETKEGEG